MRPKERLLRKRIPKDEISKELELWSDRLSNWEHVFTAVVVLGLAIEFLPEITYFLPGCFAAMVRPHAEQLREFGGLLVILGVAGEFEVGRRASRVETDLREESNAALAAAMDRVAKAELATAEAKLETEKLKSAFGWRYLQPEMVDRLATELRAKPGSIWLEYINGDAESTFFVMQFAATFRMAGWTIGTRAVMGDTLWFGIIIPEQEGELTEAGEFIASAFTKAELSFEIRPIRQWGPSIDSSPGAPEPAARIFVGLRAPMVGEVNRP